MERIEHLSTPASSEQMVNKHFLTLFDQIVLKNPENIAVIDGTHEHEKVALTYQVLQQRSYTFASMLFAKGVQAGDLIAIMLPKDSDLLAVLIAIMRLGAAYVPLDYTHPQKRLSLILDNANPVFILYSNKTRTYIPAEYQIKSLDIHALNTHPLNNDKLHTHKAWKASSFDGNDFKSNCFKNNHLAKTAYVIFTSGSTGTPKGVRISHAALSAFLLAMRDKPGCKASDRVAALTTIAFDIAGLELFLPLISGAATVLISATQARDNTTLAQLIDTHHITILQATPATFRLLLAGNWSVSQKLKKILCGGEALSPKLAPALLARAEQVWNMYGPTETTVWSTLYQVKAEDTDGSKDGDRQAPNILPIGTPIAGTTCCIVNKGQLITAPGESGELLIGGLGVAEGYHNDPEKTQQRFVSLAQYNKQQRFYRTGDRVQYNEQNQLIYLGRMDYQVKVRGFRVEMPEIERIAIQHSNIDQFAVIASNDASGETALFAFYTHTNDAPINQSKLRTFLSESLPAYMIPSTITHLKAMPLNTNGKIDRYALANLQPKRCSASDLESLFSQDLERQVYRAWCDTLGVKASHMTDNFFALGGHSIAALLLTKKVEGYLQKEVPLGLIFKHPILESFIHAIREQNDNNVSLCGPLNNANQQSSDKPLIYFICGIHLYQDLANSLDDVAKAYALYVESERDFFRENKNIPRPLPTKELASHYVDLIIKHSKMQPACICGISYGGVLALEIADQLQKKGKVIDSVFMLDTLFAGSMKRRWLYKLLSRIKSACLSGICKFQMKQNHQFQQAIDNTSLHKINYDGPITLIKAKKKIGYGMGVKFEEDYGWKHVLGRDIGVFEAEGDHLGIIKENNAAQVAHIIKTVKNGVL